MLEKLNISNFKSWKNTNSVRFSNLTGFFGTNSSGKTSILQFLLLIKQTIESSDRNQALNFGSEKDYVQLGSFHDLIYNHESDSSLNFNINFNLPKDYDVFDTEEKNNLLFSFKNMQFDSSIKQTKKKRLYTEFLAYSVSGMQFYMKKEEEGKYQYRLSSKALTEKTKKHKLIRTPGRVWELPEPIKFYGFPDQVRTYYQNAGFLFDLQLLFEQFFSKVFYLGPLRDYPKRQYTWTGSQPYDMGFKGEKFVDAILASRLKDEKISRGRGKSKLNLEEYIAYWLKELNLINDFKIVELSDGANIYQVQVQKNLNGKFVLITDVGFGVSQILPVLTLCYYVPENSVVLIEQPEIHLHPSVQAGLADVFIDAIKNRNIQIILESHSEHLLKRIQRRIAEEEINKEFAKLYFCQVEDGESILKNLELDLFGNIINWPENFFGNEIGEMYAMNQAIKNRKASM